MQILRITIFYKTPIKELITNQDYIDVKELYSIQLIIISVPEISKDVKQHQLREASRS